MLRNSVHFCTHFFATNSPVPHVWCIQIFSTPPRTTAPSASTWQSVRPSVHSLFCAYLYANRFREYIAYSVPSYLLPLLHQLHLFWSRLLDRICHPCGTFHLHGLLFLVSTSLVRYFSLLFAPSQVKAVYNFVESLSMRVTFLIITTFYRCHSCNSPATSDDPTLNSCLPQTHVMPIEMRLQLSKNNWKDVCEPSLRHINIF